MLLKKNKKVFLDIGSQGSRLISCNTGAGGTLIDRAFTNEGANLDDSLKEISQALGNPGRDKLETHVCFRPNNGLIHRINLEDSNKKLDTEFLGDLVKDQAGINPEDFHLRYIDRSTGLLADFETMDRSNILVCGIERNAVSELQKGLLATGLYPMTIELGPLANLSYLLGQDIQKEEPTVYIEISGNCAYLSVMYGGQIHVCKTLHGGFNSLLPVVQDQLGLDDLDSAKDILFSGTFDFRDHVPEFFSSVLSETQSSIDFFEIKTGQIAKKLFIGGVLGQIEWFRQGVKKSSGLQILGFGLSNFIEGAQMTLNDGVSLGENHDLYVGIAGLLGVGQLQTTQ